MKKRTFCVGVVGVILSLVLGGCSSNPKEETAIIKRLGEIFAKVNALNTVVCSKKHMHIIKNRVTLRLIYISNPI